MIKSALPHFWVNDFHTSTHKNPLESVLTHSFSALPQRFQFSMPGVGAHEFACLTTFQVMLIDHFHFFKGTLC